MALVAEAALVAESRLASLLLVVAAVVPGLSVLQLSVPKISE